MSDPSLHTALIQSILNYIASLKTSTFTSTLIKDVDSLDVAMECITQATGIAFDSQSITASNPTLPEIYEKGLAVLEQKHNDASDGRFAKFLDSLKEKGYFNNLQPGSSEYEQRMKMAREKFQSKFAGDTSSKSIQPSEQEKAQAEQFKNEGNSLLAQGRYEQAIEKYSAAIAINGQSAIYFTNRAIARINLKKWKDAAEDCKSAINCDASYAKAHYRLGQAYSAMSLHSDAVDSYKIALDLTRNDPSMNQTIRQQLEAERSKLRPANTSDSNSDDNEAGFDFASLLKNPALAGLASQLGGGGGEGGLDFSALLNNPMLQQMASSMFGGGGFNPSAFGAGAGAPATSTPASSASTATSTSSNDNSQSIGTILEDIKKNGQSAIMTHLANPSSRQKLISFIQPDVQRSNDQPLISAFEDIKDNGIMNYVSNPDIITKLIGILKTAVANYTPSASDMEV